VVLVVFHRRFKHVFVSLRHIKKESRLGSYCMLCVRILEVNIYSLFSQHLI